MAGDERRSWVWRLVQVGVAFAVGVLVGGRACGESMTASESAPDRIDRTEARRERTVAVDQGPAPFAAEPRAVAPSSAPAPPPLPGHASVEHEQHVGEVAAPRASERSLRQSAVEVVNDCRDTLMIAWLDFNSDERRPDFVLPGDTWHQSTYEHHVFRVRIANAARTFVRDLVVPEASKVRFRACGADAPEILDGGARRDSPQVKPCTVPFDTEPAAGPAASPHSRARVELHLRNTCADLPVHMQWVMFDGGLREAEVLDPGQASPYTTYIGHRFRLYDGNTRRWIRDFEVDGGADIDLCPCPE